MNRGEVILEVRDLTTEFGGLKAVDGLSFDLRKGQTLGIVGESGSGKSVTALSIMGLVSGPGHISKGSILYHGLEDPVDLVEQNDRSLSRIRGKHIGLVFQEPFSAFNPSYTCGYQIKESVDLHLALDKSSAKELIISELKRVGIHDPERIYNSYPHELSGGQLQRALIAMAIICRPSIIIADEPTTALDVTVQKNVLGLFREIVTELDASMIFISHDLGVISEIADDVMVMYRGRKMEYGHTASIFTSPGHPYTKGLLECRPRMDRQVERLPTVSDFMEVVELDGDWKVKERTTRDVRATAPKDVTQGSDHETILDVTGLKVKYPSKRNLWGKVTEYVEAVRGVSFEVRRGETVGLVGESGSGKSSIGKAIIRLIEGVEGTVNFEGTGVLTLSEAGMRPLRKDMQMIFQDPYSTLNPRMRVGKAIDEVLRVHKYPGDRKTRVIELLEKVGLHADHYDRFPRQFSGGQRQRISIARTLAVEPRFVICDESVSALDVSVQAQILNLLKDLQDELGLSYLFISHDLSVVKHMSDRVLVLKDGEIVEQGRADEIYKNPRMDYTRELIEAVPGKKEKS